MDDLTRHFNCPCKASSRDTLGRYVVDAQSIPDIQRADLDLRRILRATKCHMPEDVVYVETQRDPRPEEGYRKEGRLYNLDNLPRLSFGCPWMSFSVPIVQEVLKALGASGCDITDWNPDPSQVSSQVVLEACRAYRKYYNSASQFFRQGDAVDRQKNQPKSRDQSQVGPSGFRPRR